MDESLSDFKEKKKNCTGPKKAVKPVNKPTLKKRQMKLKGQKDIRAVLSKKNELVSYSKDFDNVCKQSGIDVDSEQLQLAVALSKSLQPSEATDSQTTQSNSQERTARIRTTLQEYGFTVPEIKIVNPNKKLRKHRKHYQLLIQSEAERQQIIVDKYSQILFQNIDSLKCSPDKEKIYENSDSKLYFVATNVAYEVLRNNNIFYLDNLSIEKTSNKGGLLRDWSEIPGRPVSPKCCEELIMDISEITCSQDELDIILSGTLKHAKSIIKNKLQQASTVIIEGEDSYEQIGVDNDVITNSIEIHSEDTEIRFEDTPTKSGTSETIRSCSPDIFDDDSLSLPNHSRDIIRSSEPAEEPSDVCVTKEIAHNVEYCDGLEAPRTDIRPLQCSQRSDVTRRKSHDMELTECVGIPENSLACKNVCPDSKNSTRRKTNDFMDLTECVTHSSQQATNIKQIIDVTQSCDVNDLTIIQEVPGNSNIQECFEKDVETMDFTQSSNSTDNFPIVNISGSNKSLDDTIILNDVDIDIIHMLPRSDLPGQPVTIENNKDDSVHLTYDKYSKKSVLLEETSNSSFDEFLYDHSDDIDSNHVNNDENYSQKCSLRPEKEEMENVDLTQNTSSSEEVQITNNDSLNNEECSKSVDRNKLNLTTINKSQLGKNVDDISIDYDEVCSNAIKDNSVNVSNRSNAYEDNNCDNVENLTQSSQESAAFEISDKELDYSIHKSRFEEAIDVLPPEVNFGGISIMDISLVHNNSNFRRVKPSLDNHTFNRSIGDSYLPEVNVKKTVESIESNQPHRPITTPCKEITIYDKVKTPNNSEYIIKTNEVTPLADFASMSTPDRNKELDRYGLKPLKRKRGKWESINKIFQTLLASSC